MADIQFPWGDDLEAWLEVRSTEEVDAAIRHLIAEAEAQKPQRLTDAEIGDAWNDIQDVRAWALSDAYRAGVRFAERAHGIGGDRG